ncbi:GNAT family N-acetyltransferase [Chamaesiphon polymorphus]|uniref:GNAT family N-acetyltransferase n=1 Tax=Chamaesiphon polymorphus CCALA 037 TaxID=2107692 RepID=A0A2T1F822_9CYAN|nr:GNAT family N-acetyltransferase [Chamaesiphon polymorphus]PSB41132.1 GNAT family N-acetyltransferase [Chamaesiphon polymorphus CCALA 037]
MSSNIAIANSISEINNCFPVMKELRSHLELPDFIDRVHRQQQLFNYQLAYLQVNEIVRAVAGFRISESLAWYKFLYVDDLVSSSDNRSQGYGSDLFNWLIEYARAESCQQLTLDSGVQRFAAHRFYLRHRMEISSHHFALHL